VEPRFFCDDFRVEDPLPVRLVLLVERAVDVLDRLR
jgi:hypothetical protein